MVSWVTTPENGATLSPLEDLLDVLDLKPVGSARITLREAHGDASMDFDLGESERDIFIGRSQPMPAARARSTRCTAISCAQAIRTTASASQSSGFATVTRSPLVGFTRSRTAKPSCR